MNAYWKYKQEVFLFLQWIIAFEDAASLTISSDIRID